jgi:serine/threonine protein kinase
MKYSVVDQNNQIEKFELIKDEKIGEGATALVYKVNYKNQTWAAKIFKDGQKINAAKIQAMLEHQPDDLSINLDGKDFIQYTWVKYVIKNGVGKVVGFMMPYVDHDETYSLDTFYDPVLSKRLKPFELALTLRIQLAINLCELIENLHKNKNYFIDIKPQNIKVYKKNHKVVLLDCDGYSINNTNGAPLRYEADLISTDYIAPEVTRDNLKPSSLGLQQDLYGLAVILFQLLNRGTHPFQGITTDKNITASTNDERAALGLYAYGLKENWKVKPRAQSVHNFLLDETRVLFDKSFETQNRTTAQEWVDHFKEILSSKKLELCNKVDRSKKLEKDLIHIKFNGKECIGCKFELEKPTKKNNKRTYTLNQNNNTISGNSSNYKPFSVNNVPISKPDDFDFAKFFYYAVGIILIIVLLAKYTEDNKTNSTNLNNNSVSVSPSPVNSPCNIDLRSSTVQQLCDSYWSKTTNYTTQCNLSISNEINARGYQSFPENQCGKKVIIDPFKTENKEKVINDNSVNKFAAMFTSLETRAVGYSINSPTEQQAINNAKIQCENLAENKDSDKCIKIISGQGRCLGISRASNGAIGVEISNDRVNAASAALKSCKDHGGLDCPLPQNTLFCSE